MILAMQNDNNSDVTRVPESVKSPATRLICPTACTDSTAELHCPFVTENNRWLVESPHAKGQRYGKRFHDL